MIKKETKGKYNSDSPAFKYFVPELKQEIKVERVFNHTYTAYFPDGAERINMNVMKKLNWLCMGKWSESNGN